MYPYIHIVLPSYTVMALLGGFLAMGFVFFRLERFSVEFTAFIKLLVVSVVGGFFGAKMLFALTRISWLVSNFSLKNLLLLIPQSGLVFYGGLFGVIFTLCFFTRKDKEYHKKVFRMIVPSMPLFHAFGRIGCFLSGCCYGKLLLVPLKIGGLTFTHIPTQLLECLAESLLFVLILIIDKRNKDNDIDLLKIYLVLYACIRFADEFLRGDVVRGIYFGLSTSQWISIFILLFYLVSALKIKISSNTVNNKDLLKSEKG